MTNTITLDEFSEIFKYLLNNNRKLIDSGKKPTAVGITGAAGLGKTTVIQDLAISLGMTFVKVCLSEIEEISDLVGFPLKEYKARILVKDGDNERWEERWVSHDLLNTYLSLPCGTYEFTDETRMSYAPPKWLPKEYNDKGTILLLDDYTRANSMFLQATMTLINDGTYISWSLPKYTSVVLTNNPDNGDYQVSSLDAAMQSRFINFNVAFDVNGWAKWAEFYGLDDRAINFGLSYAHEIFNSTNLTLNPRSYTTFCNAISGIPDWSTPKALALILNIAKGCFDDEQNVVGNLFTIFIANKLDKLISPEDLLTQDWVTCKQRLLNCVYEKGVYHPEIAAVLSTRLLNYSLKYLSESGNKTNVIEDRLLEIVESEKMIFSEDLLFNVIKTLVVKYPGKMNKLLLKPQIRSKII